MGSPSVLTLILSLSVPSLLRTWSVFKFSACWLACLTGLCWLACLTGLTNSHAARADSTVAPLDARDLGEAAHAAQQARNAVHAGLQQPGSLEPVCDPLELLLITVRVRLGSAVRYGGPQNCKMNLHGACSARSPAGLQPTEPPQSPVCLNCPGRAFDVPEGESHTTTFGNYLSSILY